MELKLNVELDNPDLKASAAQVEVLTVQLKEFVNHLEHQFNKHLWLLDLSTDQNTVVNMDDVNVMVNIVADTINQDAKLAHGVSLKTLNEGETSAL